ncbi:MAG: hypothetical protein IBX60_08155 [Candidatus Aminicenantes bacterium]|nr:hypothetical protein [Candidatus Aminicenantes bacterium]
MTEDGALSLEVDIIVYEGSPFHEWRTEVMRFTLVPKEQVRFCIECCGFLYPTMRHKKHLEEILKFSSKVVLYAECCWSKEKRTCKKRKKTFLNTGFGQFFYLYRWYYGMDKEVNEADWFHFLDTIRNL